MKKILVFLYVMVVVLCLSGCSFFGYEEDADMELTAEDISLVKSTVAPVAVSEGSVSQIKTVSIYTIDSIEEELVPLKVPMSTDRITPEFILDEVLSNIDEKVEITEIEVENSRIYVSFNNDYAPVKKCSRKFETLILDCVANSLLDNISYINEVVFQCEDGAYHSYNFEFQEDEVYCSN